jgi:hypothetical protein
VAGNAISRSGGDPRDEAIEFLRVLGIFRPNPLERGKRLFLGDIRPIYHDKTCTVIEVVNFVTTLVIPAPESSARVPDVR